MENFSQVESNILNKIKNISDRNSLDLVKTEIFGKKGIITELFKNIGSLDQGQKKEYALKLNDLKTKVTEILEKKLVDFDQTEINKELGAVDIVGKIDDNQRASAIDAIHDMLFSKASEAMADYKKVVANTFFDEPTETETEVTDETDNGND